MRGYEEDKTVTTGENSSDVGQEQTNAILYLFHTNLLKIIFNNFLSVHMY